MIYCLQLEHNKYYIGQTNYPYVRLQDNLALDNNLSKSIYPPDSMDSNGLIWIRNHNPIRIIELYKDADINTIIEKYMTKYGIDNVRGGIILI